MEFKELKNKSVKELHKLLAENREKLRDMRFSVSAKQLKNIREIREVKKLIARILTVLKIGTSQDQDLENNQVKE